MTLPRLAHRTANIRPFEVMELVKRASAIEASGKPVIHMSIGEPDFGAPPAVWHSELTPALRRETLRAVAEGRVNVVVGARSALFLPFADLQLIVVDEEHESAFKQEDGVMYHARDMAVLRARLAAAPCALVSATPSLESVENAASGHHHHHGGSGCTHHVLGHGDRRREPRLRGHLPVELVHP